MSKPVVILHLSDLHFGPNHRWALPGRGDKSRPTLVSLLDDALRDFAVSEDLLPDIIVVSGDIIDEPIRENFEAAVHFLRSLLETINELRQEQGRSPITKRNMFIVPGNSDVAWTERTDVRKRFEPYRGFLEAFYGILTVPDGELYSEPARDYLYRVDILEDLRVAMLGLNSCMYDEPASHAGLVTDGQLQQALNEFERRLQAEGVDSGKYLKVAVLHHHPHFLLELQHDPTYRVMQDALSVIRALEDHEFDLVLHGHKHHTAAKPVFTSRYGVDVWKGLVNICAGSVGANGCDSSFQFIKVTSGDRSAGALWKADILPIVIPKDATEFQWTVDEEHKKSLTVDLHKQKADVSRIASIFSAYISRGIEEFENFDVRQARLAFIEPRLEYDVLEYYVDLAVSEIRGGRIRDPFDPFFEEWLDSPGRNIMVVLGDYGAGKSSLCWHLFYKMAKKYQEDPSKSRVPLIFSLKGRGPIKSPRDFVKRLLKTYEIKMELSEFERLLEEGRFLFIFDGFDEMYEGGATRNVTSVWKKLTELGIGDAKVLITSRSQFFKSQAHVNDLLYPTEETPLMREAKAREIEIAELRDWSTTQIEEFLKKHWKENWRYYWGRAEAAIRSSLTELARRPLFLKLIVATLPSLFKRKEEVTLNVLFNEYVKYVLRREREHSDTQTIQDDDKLAIIEKLAVHLFLEEKRQVDGSKLLEIVDGHFSGRVVPEPDLRRYREDICRSGFLVQDGAHYRFFNDLFLGFFAAKKLMQDFRSRRFDDFTRKPLIPEVAMFLSDMLQEDKEALYDAISETRHLTFDTTGYTGSNAITLLKLQGEKFKEKDFSFTVLRGANLSGANLERSNLSSCDLREAVLDSSVLTGANFEDADLTGASIREVNKIGNLKFSPAGRYIATGDNFGAIKIWNFDKGSLEKAFDAHKKDIWSISWCPVCDKHSLVSGSLDKSVKVWDVQTGESSKLGEHADAVLSVDWSPDGTLVVSSGNDGMILVWEVSTGKIVWSQPVGEQVYCARWSADGKYIASASGDRRITIWDYQRRQRKFDLMNHQDTVWNVSWHPSGNLLASGSKDQTVRVWDISTGREIERFPGGSSGHMGAVLYVAWSPDGRYIASSGADMNVIIWSWSDRRPIFRRHAHTDDIWSLCWDPTGRFLVSGSDDATIKVWTPNRQEPVSVIPQLLRCKGMNIKGVKGLTSEQLNFLRKGGAEGYPRWF